jgi:broad specificity phosphatase PhoE
MSAAPIVYLIRHGETADNARRVLQMPDVPLSERGLEQARRLGARLAGAGIVRILVSDYERARMTARAVAEATGAPLHEDPLLRERHFGDLRGRAYSSLGFDPFAPGYAPPNGESIPMFTERVARAFEAIRTHAASAGGPLAVVTHGLVCRDLVANHLKLPPDLAAAQPDPYRWTNTCVTEVDPSTWTVRLLACTSHLDDIAEVAPV